MDHFELADWLRRKKEATEILEQPDVQRWRCSSVPVNITFGLQDYSVVLKRCNNLLNRSLDSCLDLAIAPGLSGDQDSGDNNDGASETVSTDGSLGEVSKELSLKRKRKF